MSRPAHRIALLVATFALALACAPGAALADDFDAVFADYQRDGQVDPCQHSEAELRRAKAQVPNDIEQYAPDFEAALDAALEERARGGCRKGAGGDGADVPAGDGGPGAAGSGGGAGGASGGAPAIPDGGQPGGHANDTAGTPSPPGAQRAAPPVSDGAISRAAETTDRDGGADVPVALLALAIAAALLLLALLVWALTRWLAWSPRWAGSARHAVAEAGWRTSGAWSDFADWVRTRRGTA